MGIFTSMDCPCGFFAEVKYGRGMAVGPEDVFPHFCARCGLVSASINMQNPPCPTCGSHEIIRYGERRVSGTISAMLENQQQGTCDTWTHDPRVTKPEGDPIFDWNDCRITKGKHRCPSCSKFDMVTGSRFIAYFD